MKREKQISFAASRFDRFARSKKGAAFLSAQVRISDFSRYAVGFFVTAAMLAGCGGSQPPVAAPPPAYARSSHFSQPGSTNGYQLLYAFRGNSNSNLDGDLPYSSLIAVKNRLYGTTIKGGNLNYSACGRGKFFAGCGTVFEVSASGKERALYRFAGGSDGFFPYAGLLALNGTTSDGGGVPCKRHGSCGTVFPPPTSEVFWPAMGVLVFGVIGIQLHFMLVFAALCLVLLLQRAHYNREVFPRLFQAWSQSFLCFRCGAIMFPRVTPQARQISSAPPRDAIAQRTPKELP